jgi:nitroimidazol reductase NimA-like FMN-containing flavoprotein (pyridoxamine 5'-phosphate oxidase superfamily)
VGANHVRMSELTMKKAWREAFLADLHVGVVAVARDGEPPLAAPVWYSYEPGGDVVFVFESASEKIELFADAGQASLCVQNEAVPYKYVTVEGPAVVCETDDNVQRSYSPWSRPRGVQDPAHFRSASKMRPIIEQRWMCVEL